MEKFTTPKHPAEAKDILANYPKVKGRFYHGCPKNVNKLLPPDVTGEIRFGEEERRSFKDVIFLTKNINQAIDYAGYDGVVFITDAEAIQYKQVASDILNPKKAKSVSDDIYIAMPEDIKIVAKWHKEKGRKRGNPQKYIDEYVGEQE